MFKYIVITFNSLTVHILISDPKGILLIVRYKPYTEKCWHGVLCFWHYIVIQSAKQFFFPSQVNIITWTSFLFGCTITYAYVFKRNYHTRLLKIPNMDADRKQDVLNSWDLLLSKHL